MFDINTTSLPTLLPTLLMSPQQFINIDRQAVLIIHGIGDQTPTDTLRGFVKTVAPFIQNSKKPRYFSKPDAVSDSYELRRMTANPQQNSVKTDYYEFYWAHLMQGTKLSDVWWWFKNLLVRPYGHIPSRIRWIYWTIWLLPVGLLGLGLLIYGLLPDVREVLRQNSPHFYLFLQHTSTFIADHKTIFSFALGILSLIPSAILTEYVGDVARYTTPKPRNIAERHAIRKAGLDLLKKLHEKDETGKDKYDRIIIVGHSLGSMIAYDLLNLYWCSINSDTKTTDTSILEQIELAAHRLVQAAKKHRKNPTDMAAQQFYETELATFREAQFACWKSLHGQLPSWRISDLITIGSPLSHARLLMAMNPFHLGRKIVDREYPVCPPVTEANETFTVGTDTIRRFSYNDPQSPTPPRPRLLNHSAPFALTRWTNLYFENDYVGGPINGVLGVGILDKCLRAKKHGGIPFRSHTTYWNGDEPDSVKFIRKTLQLRITAKELKL